MADLWTDIKNESGCKCKQTELRYLEINQPGKRPYRQYKHQCLTCGKASSAIGHSKLTTNEKVNAKPFDKGLSNRYWKDKNNVVKAKYEQSNQAKKQEWFNNHTDYLKSPEWRAKREKVFRRDGYVCQSCLQNQAQQVHHLSYKHWGHEPLYELISVCVSCHEKITRMDRATRTGAKITPEYGGTAL